MLKLKNITIVGCVTVTLLLIPLIAMIFTEDVKWSVSDFSVMGAIIFTLGLVITGIYRKDGNHRKKVILIASTIIIFLLLWIEIAVGVFNSPIAGN